jgi:hypothetical protein
MYFFEHAIVVWVNLTQTHNKSIIYIGMHYTTVIILSLSTTNSLSSIRSMENCYRYYKKNPFMSGAFSNLIFLADIGVQ